MLAENYKYENDPDRNGGVDDYSLANIQRIIDPLIEGDDDVALQQKASSVFAVINGLRARGKDADALPYLKRILRADPWEFEYQLTYGELLAKQGQPEELHKRAVQAIRLAEVDGTIRRAYKLAGIPLPPPLPLLGRSTDEAPELVLVSLAGVNQFWLADLRDQLASRLGIKVSVARIQIPIGPPDRTGLQLLAKQERSALLELIPTHRDIDAFLTKQGYTIETIEASDDVVMRAYRDMVVASKDQEQVFLLDNRTRDAAHEPGQWDVSKLLDKFHQATAPYGRPHRWFLGVIDHDIFLDQGSFLFGCAPLSASYGIISPYRFTAKFNGEHQKRARLETRLLKQALSSYGFLLGVPRCTDPECARSYSSNLDDQDSKSDILCDECRAKFEKSIGQTLPNPAKSD